MIDVAHLFPGASGYLNTASIGLPPQPAVDAMRAAIAEWQDGRAKAPRYDAPVAAAREAFAAMMGTAPNRVAIGAQVSAMIGLAVTVLPPGSRVLLPEGEFTSVSFPFLVREDLGLEIKTVSLERLAESIGPQTTMVAFSAVQSADGAVANLTEIKQAAAANGAITLVDATQAAGWLPLQASDFDIMIAGAYKWLLSPRGTAFAVFSQPMVERAIALYAGWYAGDSPWESIYGLPLRLATDARRLDLSPGWLAWVGTAPALHFLNEVGVEQIHGHNAGLANAFLTELGMEPTDSAIVSLQLRPGFDDARLEGLSTAYRAGRLRVGFHLYNTMEDVTRVAAAVKGSVLP